MKCRCRAEKFMLVRQTKLHTIILLERKASTCIFSSLPSWMSLQGNQMSCVLMLCTVGSLCLHGLIICFGNPTWFSAGCLRNWQLGSEMTMGMSWAYPPRAASSGQLGSWMLSWKTTWSPTTLPLNFCWIQWECELYSWRPKAQCYPFNLAGHSFWGKNHQLQVFHAIWYQAWYHILCQIWYLAVRRIVRCYWHPNPTTRTLFNYSTSRLILTSRGTA